MTKHAWILILLAGCVVHAIDQHTSHQQTGKKHSLYWKALLPSSSMQPSLLEIDSNLNKQTNTLVPEAMELGTLKVSLKENSPSGTAIAELEIDDFLSSDDPPVVSFVSSTSSSDGASHSTDVTESLFHFGSGDKAWTVFTSFTPDYETKTEFTFSVEAYDGVYFNPAQPLTLDFQVDIADANDVEPYNIGVSTDEIEVNMELGDNGLVEIASITWDDEDTCNTNTVELSGNKSGLFNVKVPDDSANAATLYTNTEFETEGDDYELTLTVSDGVYSVEHQFTLSTVAEGEGEETSAAGDD